MKTEKPALYFLVSLIIVFLVLTALLLSGFAAPIVLGIILSGISYPLYKRLKRKSKERSTGTALVTLLLVILVIVVPLAFISVFLFQQAVELFFVAHSKIILLGNDGGLLQQLSSRYEIDLNLLFEEYVTPSLKSIGLYISSQLGNLFSNALNLVLGFFIMAATIFYFLRDGELIGKAMMRLSPLKSVDELHVYRRFKEVSWAIFYGTFISAGAQGLLAGLGFWIFGLAAPVLWGVIMGFLSLIPLLGPYIIFIPAAIFLFFTKSLALTIGFLIYNIILVSSIDNVIKPLVIGDKVKIHPLLILLSILGGLKFFGIVGIVYGPLIIAILITLTHIYTDNHHATRVPDNTNS
jgi:predicted PurR-regulated permease PerM